MRFAVIPHPGKENALELAREVRSYIRKQGHVVVRKALNADVGVVISGDGFMLDTVQKLSPHSIPSFGINAGGTGFLTIGSKRKWKSYIKRICSGDYEIQKRIMIEAEVGGKKYGPFSNDVFFDHPVSVCMYAVYSGKNKVYQIEARGMIVATPSGSTAYNSSEGGPIAVPGVEALILTPSGSTNFSVRPVVNLPGKEVRVELLSSKGGRKVRLRGSGKSLAWVAEGENYKVRRHELDALFVMFDDYDHFQTLREKKHFAIDTKN